MAEILICAPDPLADDLHGTVIWRGGNQRHLAASFEEAFVMAVAVRPDLVVIDRDLPRAGAVDRGPVLNLSLTGMLIEAEGGLAVGADLDFKFQLPGEAEPIRGTGQIVRESERDHFGVRFCGLEGDGAARVGAFVARDAAAPRR